jgi:CheY-like chemotaxis protein
MANVLIVDDHPDTCRAMAMLVRRLGHHAVCRNSGRDALDYLASEPPNLVLLDLMMPEMDGLEVLRQIRADTRMDGVRVVLFSAVENPALRLQATQAGASDYWLKAQLDAEQIKSRLMGYLNDPRPSENHNH